MPDYRHFLHRGMNFATRFTVRRFTPVLARMISYMARTGLGTDECLRRGALPMPVHYHSPVPDLKDLEQRQVWNRRSDLAGIDFRPEAQVAFLRELGQEFGRECDWPLLPSDDLHQLHIKNGNFSYGCAASLHCVLRHFKPRRVIEIGSGNSSLVVAAALSLNSKESATGRGNYTIVDPYPRPIIENGLPGLTQLIKERVELLDVGFFNDLRENDVLFIDSGHTVRTGSDVNYLMLEVLPRLSPGVIVHFHDIHLPYEYSRVYATNPQFRMFWTEAYLLQAFLCLNSQFEVLLGLAYLMMDQRDSFQSAFPLYDPIEHQDVSGSFWIRRRLA